MITSRILGAVALCVGMVWPVAADVTLRQKTSGKGIAGTMAGELVQYIKGTKMRTDQMIGGESTSTILDANTRRMIVLHHTKREAEVHDMATIGEQIATMTAGEADVSVTPTAQTRQIAGTTCAVHQMRVVVPAELGGTPMTFVLEGPICLAESSPGATDYATFFEAAAESGLFFSDPRVAQAQPGQAKGLTALYREMASRGVPYATEIQVKIEGSGPMAAMMSKMGGMTMTSEVVSISTDSVPASMFEIPEGYRQRH